MFAYNLLIQGSTRQGCSGIGILLLHVWRNVLFVCDMW